jgi:hypothetical protein
VALAHISAKCYILLIISEEYRKKKKTMEFIEPQQRKSHKHDPIVKSILITLWRIIIANKLLMMMILITAINILTQLRQNWESQFFPVSDLLESF